MAAVEGAIGYHDIANVAAGLCADLNAADASGPIASSAEEQGAIRVVEDGPYGIAGSDGAVGDGYLFGGADDAEAVGALEDDGVVEGGVHRASVDVDVAAGVDVDAVASGVDGEILDGEVVDGRGENAEVAGFADREVAQKDVAATFEGDHLVTCAGMLFLGAVALLKAATPELAGAYEGDAFEVLTPEEAVVPVVMAVVLEVANVVGLRLGSVVLLRRLGEVRRGGEDNRSGCETERDMAAKVDRETEVSSGGEIDEAATDFGRCGDGSVDGKGIECGSVARGAEVAYVEGFGSFCGPCGAPAEHGEERSAGGDERSARDDGRAAGRRDDKPRRRVAICV